MSPSPICQTGSLGTCGQYHTLTGGESYSCIRYRGSREGGVVWLDSERHNAQSTRPWPDNGKCIVYIPFRRCLYATKVRCVYRPSTDKPTHVYTRPESSAFKARAETFINLPGLAPPPRGLAPADPGLACKFHTFFPGPAPIVTPPILHNIILANCPHTLIIMMYAPG